MAFATLLSGCATTGTPETVRAVDRATFVPSTTAAAATPLAAPASVVPLVEKRRKRRGPPAAAVGVQFHGLWSSYSDRDRAVALDRIAAMGARWVRIDISWAMLQPNPGAIDARGWGPQFIDHVISMAHARGLRVLGTFWLTPGWANGYAGERVAPRDPATYGRAFAWAARRWAGKVQAWEAWNEPNSGDFLVGADPTTYTRLLCAAYRSTQALPGPAPARVVYGGTMHNDVPWIARTYRAGAKGCFDVMATHPYQSPSGTSPLSGRGTSIWEFQHLRAVRALMVRNGDRRPVWLTEFGWSSHANTGREAGWEQGVTEAQQASFTVAALRTLRQRYPWVRRAFLYTDRANPGEGVHQAGFGLMTNDLRPKPVYHAVRSWVRSNPPWLRYLPRKVGRTG
ncbi:cellulase family glycosylhydrolase [Nocardioides litoris]|uniref:cellulase family glycosylhydrolase n=1 Tax=Nocardioides litoris TaxID=1926648 RepID=UPI00111E8F10|nr:cellulase family glycosylhydrolase [Nocardioides litoris]